MSSTDKTLTLKGHGLLNQRLEGDIQLKASVFPFIHTPEYQVDENDTQWAKKKFYR